MKVEVGLKFEITILTQHLSLSIFDPNLGWNKSVQMTHFRINLHS